MDNDPQKTHAFDFQGSISRPVLENYLAHSITMAKLLSGVGCAEDNLRMVGAIGAKFIGRSICHWGAESYLPTVFLAGRSMAERVHQIDPQIILQAGIFETLTTEVGQIAVPAWVFAAFGRKAEPRHFSYRDMLFPDGTYHNHWGPGASVPDITRLETQMWFFYQAASYIDLGIEALHFGQVQLMGRNDPGLRSWFTLLERVRGYAREHARRGVVICDAHVSSGVNCYGLTPIPPDQPLGYSLDGRLLLDVHALPMRIKEMPGRPHQGELAVGHLDAIYGRSMVGPLPAAGRATISLTWWISTVGGKPTAAVRASTVRSRLWRASTARSGCGGGMRSIGLPASLARSGMPGCGTPGSGCAAMTPTALWKCPGSRRCPIRLATITPIAPAPTARMDMTRRIPSPKSGARAGGDFKNH